MRNISRGAPSAALPRLSAAYAPPAGTFRWPRGYPSELRSFWREGSADGYSYPIASQRMPETLTIWHDGEVVLSTPANTGIAIAPLAGRPVPGLREAAVPGHVGRQPGRDPLRGSGAVGVVLQRRPGRALLRPGSYGWQQSLGCVELPCTAAAEAYPYLPYGTLVTPP